MILKPERVTWKWHSIFSSRILVKQYLHGIVDQETQRFSVFSLICPAQKLSTERNIIIYIIKSNYGCINWMHVDIPIVPCIFVPCTDNTALTLQWRGNNGVAQLGLKGHDNKCDKLQSDAGHKKKRKQFFIPFKCGRVRWITESQASEMCC